MFAWSSVCGVRPAVMGVVNVTPDSFSDGGRHLVADDAVRHGAALVDAGADVLDVGGESTRPGAASVEAAEELARVLPVIERLAAEAGVPISVDTTKADVADAALSAGAAIVNDVSAGLADPRMLTVVAERGAGYVAMHMRGEPRTMQDDVRYDDVVREVGDHLLTRRDAALEAGVAVESLCVDPGIGFGKLAAHNIELLARLGEIVQRVGVPVLVGASRKSFLGSVLRDARGATGSGLSDPADRDDATLATTMWAVDHGVSVVRVHDVEASACAVQLWAAMRALDAMAVA
jgi:dihydropteroate synthase